MWMFQFTIKSQDPRTPARVGEFVTPHGTITTPVFMPCATYGAIKTLTPEEVRACGAEIILSNTFHMHLRPGEELVKKFGGIRTFMHWDGPILTDSGGFQVFSLSKMRKIYDDRIEFASPVDGSRHVFTPASVLAIQRSLGSTIAMQLDECVPGDASHAVARTALDRTTRWAEESVKIWLKNQHVGKPKKAAGRPEGLGGSHSHKIGLFEQNNSVNPSGQMSNRFECQQALFPIVQGASYADLRAESADFCAGLPTPGVAIGGLAVGETKRQFLDTLDIVLPRLSKAKPRYLMGVGEPLDIVQAVARGVDMFDCVMPTRLARHGSFFSLPIPFSGQRRSSVGAGPNARGREDITRADNRLSGKPLLMGCRCEACTHYTRGYLRHLFVTNETLGARLLTLHNLTYMFDLMSAIRTAIQTGKYEVFVRKFMEHQA